MYKILPDSGFIRDPETIKEPSAGSPEQAILCSSCRIRITWKEASISVNNSHRHVFVNPSGLVFEVVCFSRAVGLTVLGPVTSEFTWFPGYSWQTALCSKCQTQLGWIYYGSEPSVFFGLIQDRLIED